MKKLVRLFLAVFPPPEFQQAVFDRAAALRAGGDPVSWVKVENLHYTLRFLGDVGEDGARRACDAAVEAASGATVFTATLGAFGAFPNARRARVLWAGLDEGADPLVALARRLDDALKKRGFGRAERPFAPHLTIGRVRDQGGDWSERLSVPPTTSAAPRFVVDRVSAVESQLSPRGSIYRVRANAPLVP